MPHPTTATSTVRTALLASVLALLAGLLMAAPALAQRSAATHIVQLRPGTSPATARAIVRAAGGRVTGTLSIIDAVAAELPGGAAAALARNPRVAAVSANAGVRPQAADVMA